MAVHHVVHALSMFLSISVGNNHLKAEVCFICTLSLIVRIFTIIYNVLQHYCDERCSHESWSSLLTSLLVENNGGEKAFKVLRQSGEKRLS